MKTLFAVAVVAAVNLACTPGPRRPKRQKLTIYCAVQIQWCQLMKARFAEKTGIKVSMTRKSSGETLAQVAGALELGDYLCLAKSESAAGGSANPANLANLCEALIGALYLDGGLAAAAAFVRREWAGRLAAPGAPPRDAKTALQEWSQAAARGLPAYRTVESSGPAHAPEFEVEVAVAGVGSARGRGSSKRAAERVAAAALLVALERNNERAGERS